MERTVGGRGSPSGAWDTADPLLSLPPMATTSARTKTAAGSTPAPAAGKAARQGRVHDPDGPAPAAGDPPDGRRAGHEPDLEALAQGAEDRDRAALPGRRPRAGRPGLRPRRRGAHGPAAGVGRAVRHAPDRRRRRSSPSSASTRSRSQAALLHDVPEDTEYSLTDVEERFGPEVAQLVDGVTKLSKFSTHSHEQQQAENIRKMFLAMAEDIRVVLIKLADRLHNMRTLDALPSEKQQRIARQTVEIYAPLAERLGIWQIKWELEDLAFKALEPRRFRELAKLLDTRRKGRESYIERAIDELRPKLEAAGIEADIEGRPKHIYSIWKKMQRKSAEFGEIYDVYAIRVLVDEVRDCYAALGIVHSLWRPIPGQFDDYIAMPKNNLYQSLHTAVIALDGKPLEIQIRTHADAPGLARSASPPTGATRRAPSPTASTTRSSPGCASSWTGSATSATRPSSSRASSSTSSRTRSSCSRPKGDIKDLPAGATPLDFAYRIHTDVGHRTIGAKVNNRLVPARLPAQERRHRRDRDHQGRARPVARLAERRPDQPRPGEDPAMVQAPGARREHRPRPRVARARAAAAGPDLDRDGRRGPARRGRQDPATTRPSTTSTPRSATARSAPSRWSCAWASSTTPERRCPTVAPPRTGPRPAASGSRASATCSSASRKCCHPIPGDPIVGLHHPRQGRHRPPADLPDGRQRARGQPPHRGRVGGRSRPRPTRSPSGSRRTTGPACCRTSPTSSPRPRSTSSPPTSPSRRITRPSSPPRSRSPRSASWPA